MNRPVDSELVAAAQAARAQGSAPIAVLDIDLTVVENAPRTRRIWRLWLESLGDRWDGAARALRRVDTMPIVFGVMLNLTELGVQDEALRKEGFRFWLEKFFDDQLCRVDIAMPGAVEAVHALRAEGITVAYLTARPAWMREGTVATLDALGFPVCTAGTVLVMKPDMEIADEAYKAEALVWLRSLGEVILAADNEPGHCNAMRAAFAGARVLHVNSRHSASAPPLNTSVDVVAALSEGVFEREGGR